MGARCARSQDQGRLIRMTCRSSTSTDIGSSGAFLLDEGRSKTHTESAASGVPIGAVRPNRILDVSYAFWRTKALLSAVELNLFTVLAHGPLDPAALVTRLGLHGRCAHDF